MADILLKCPKCAQVIAAESAYAGKRIECPNCGQHISISSGGIRFRCPSCEAEFIAAAEMATSDCECPNCDAKLHVPILGDRTPPPKLQVGVGTEKHPLRMLALGGLLILVPLTLWGVWHRGDLFGKTATPSVQTKPVEAKTGPIKVDFFTSRSEGEAFSVFHSYEEAIHAADLTKAAAQLAVIRNTFTTPKQESAFWQKAIPDGRGRELVLYAICDQCTSGECTRCMGVGVCPGCNGLAFCPLCKGLAPKALVCTKCLCSKCSGSGRCSGCRGKGQQLCSTCSGSGEVSENITKPCPSCGGSGYKPGLMRADGSADRLMCVRCKGTGKALATRRVTCGTCGGNGTVPCRICSGTGKCPSCYGRGRSSFCSACNGTGSLITQCVKCGGTGKCPVCQGGGKCPDCRGHGVCGACGGHAATVKYTFPVDSTWLQHGSGYIAVDGASGGVVASGDAGPSSSPLKKS